jgi:hypothetical protein
MAAEEKETVYEDKRLVVKHVRFLANKRFDLRMDYMNSLACTRLIIRKFVGIEYGFIDIDPVKRFPIEKGIEYVFSDKDYQEIAVWKFLQIKDIKRIRIIDETYILNDAGETLGSYKYVG